MYKLKRRITALLLAVTIFSVNCLSAYAEIDKSALSQKYYDVNNEEWAENGFLNPDYFDSFGNAYDEDLIPQFTYDEDGNITGANDAYYYEYLQDSKTENLKVSLTEEEYNNYMASLEEYPVTLEDVDVDAVLSGDTSGSDDEPEPYFAAAAVTAVGLTLCAVLIAAATGYIFSKSEAKNIVSSYENHLRVSGNSLLLNYLMVMISANRIKETLSGWGSLVSDFRTWWKTKYYKAVDTSNKKVHFNVEGSRADVTFSPFNSVVKSSGSRYYFTLNADPFLSDFSPNYSSAYIDYYLPDFEPICFYYAFNYNTSNSGYYMPLYFYIYYKDSSGKVCSSYGRYALSYKGFPSNSEPFPSWRFNSTLSEFGYQNSSRTKDSDRYKTILQILYRVSSRLNVPLFMDRNAASNYANGLFYDKESEYTGSSSLSYSHSYKYTGDYSYADDYSYSSDEEIDSLYKLLQSASSETEAASYIKQYLSVGVTGSEEATKSYKLSRWEYLIDSFAAAGGVTDYDYKSVTQGAAKKLDDDGVISFPDPYSTSYQAEVIQISDYMSSSGGNKDPKKDSHFIKKAVAAAIAFSLGLELSGLKLNDNINIINDNTSIPSPNPGVDLDVDLSSTNNILTNILNQLKTLPKSIYAAFSDMLIGIKEAVVNLPDLMQGVLAGDPMALQQYLAQINTSVQTNTDALKNLDSAGSSGSGSNNIEESNNDSDSSNIFKGFVYIPFLLFVLLIIFINCMRLIICIFNIQASTDIFNADFIKGFDYMKTVQLPLFNISLYQLLIGGCYFCLLCSVIRVLRKRIDRINS